MNYEHLNEFGKMKMNEILKAHMSSDNRKSSSARDAMNGLLRTRLYDASFARKLFTFDTVTDADLETTFESDMPCVKRYKEPNSPQAGYVTFGMERPSLKTWSSDKYPIYFHRLATEEWVKNKIEAATYPKEVKQFIDNQFTWALGDAEDYAVLSAIQDAIATAGSTRVISGLTGINKDTIKKIIQTINTYNLPGAEYKLFMKENLYLEILQNDAIEVGDAIAGQLATDGIKVSRKETKELFGMEVITTRKNEVGYRNASLSIPDDVIYVIPPKDFFGDFLIYRDVEVVVDPEKSRENLSMFADEYIGMGIGNVNSVFKAEVTITP